MLLKVIFKNKLCLCLKFSLHGDLFRIVIQVTKIYNNNMHLHINTYEQIITLHKSLILI